MPCPADRLECENLQSGVNFHAGSSTYCLGEAARANMISAYGWTIYDGDKDCPEPATIVIEKQTLPDGDPTNLPPSAAMSAAPSVTALGPRPGRRRSLHLHRKLPPRLDPDRHQLRRRQHQGRYRHRHRHVQRRARRNGDLRVHQHRHVGLHQHAADHGNMRTYPTATTSPSLPPGSAPCSPSAPPPCPATSSSKTWAGAPGALSGIFDNDAVGDHAVSLQVSDELGLSNIQDFTITVSNVNDAPTFESYATRNLVSNISYTYAITSTDEDGDTGLYPHRPHRARLAHLYGRGQRRRQAGGHAQLRRDPSPPTCSSASGRTPSAPAPSNPSP